MTPSIKVYMDELNMHNHGRTNVIPGADTPQNSCIIFKEMDTGLVPGAVAAGTCTTRLGKPSIGHSTTHRQGIISEATYALAAGPEEKVGTDTPQATYKTLTMATMSNITQR